EELVAKLLAVAITPEIIAQDGRVRRAQRELSETQLLLNTTQRDLWPHLGLSMSYDEKLGWGLGLNVSYNLFARQDLKLKQAEIAHTAARRQLATVQKTVE
ncbi:MAG: hypothetical protein N3E42_07300, partial [Candidatus Bipolaricaulota bacterium]|nr:hypothetical protein [Candidatus Bipolaricaulota bacterium]